MGTGVFVHGLNLNNPEWEHVIWGSPPDNLGRVPKAVHYLRTRGHDVGLMLFGSGASEKEGLKEAEYTLRYLMRNWHRLQQFRHFKECSWLGMQLLKRRVKRLARTETSSRNTYSELEYALPLFAQAGVDRIVVVSELTHVSRCFAHLADLAGRELGGVLMPRVELSLEASTALPMNADPKDVVVFEPPADGSGEPGVTFRKFFSLPAERRAEALAAIRKILS